jgi:hypothetical protein
MLADIPAVAYTESWGGFLSAEFTANFKIDFFTSSSPFNIPNVRSTGAPLMPGLPEALLRAAETLLFS